MKLLLTIVFFFTVHHLGAQTDSSFHLVHSFPGEITDAAIDNLGNVYVLSSTDQLKKYNSNGDSVAAYNNVRRYGKLHSMDVSNPLKLLLYYKDYSSIVILDRLLAVRSSIDLRRNNLLQVNAIGLSYDNNIWVFDEYDNKLKKINEEGKLLLETPDLRMVFSQSISPKQILDHNNQLYLYDPTNGLYIFDQLGSFKRKIPVTGWSNIGITDKYITGIGNNTLQAYNVTTLLQSEQKLPGYFVSYYRYFLSHNRLLALSKEGLHIYRY